MPEINKFLGINNIQEPERTTPGELAAAINVDIDTTAALKIRSGHQRIATGAYHSVFENGALALVVKDGDLVYLNNNGTVRNVIREDVGTRRLWYRQGPDSRIYITNGFNFQGVTDGLTLTDIGVPVPPHVGNAGNVGGGETFLANVAIGYRRQSDGLEGGLAFGTAQLNGTELSFVGLPALDGYDIVVYASPAEHAGLYRLGTTDDEDFAFRPAGVLTGINTWDELTGVDTMTRPLRRDEFMSPPPIGRHMAFWNGRLLLSRGNVLWASRPWQYEHFDLRRDFKQMDEGEEITLVEPMADGIWVGTTKGLYFLAGDQFDTLQLRRMLQGRVVRGSAARVDGTMVKGRQKLNMSGEAVLLIVDGYIAVAGASGSAQPLTDEYYATTAAEVWANATTLDGYLKYTAVPV